MGPRAFVAAAFAAQAILVTPAGAAAATDLHPLLAGPPSSNWSAVPAAPDILVGDFTAQSYAAYLKAAGGSPGATEFELGLFGFTRGFALVWEQQTSRDLLIERVFEFRNNSGARSWYSRLRSGDKTADEYTGDIPVPASVPNSSGSSFKWSDGQLEDTVDFRKGNLVFVIDMASYASDLSAPTVVQASAEYANAPSQTEVPPGAGQAVNSWLRSAAAVAGAVLVAVALITGIAIVLLTRRRRRAAIDVEARPTMSADASYWWDGQRWRDATLEAPPTAPRSPDGAYWWDGRTWRLRPAPRSPG